MSKPPGDATAPLHALALHVTQLCSAGHLRSSVAEKLLHALAREQHVASGAGGGDLSASDSDSASESQSVGAVVRGSAAPSRRRVVLAPPERPDSPESASAGCGGEVSSQAGIDRASALSRPSSAGSRTVTDGGVAEHHVGMGIRGGDEEVLSVDSNARAGGTEASPSPPTVARSGGGGDVGDGGGGGGGSGGGSEGGGGGGGGDDGGGGGGGGGVGGSSAGETGGDGVGDDGGSSSRGFGSGMGVLGAAGGLGGGIAGLDVGGDGSSGGGGGGGGGVSGGGGGGSSGDRGGARNPRYPRHSRRAGLADFISSGAPSAGGWGGGGGGGGFSSAAASATGTHDRAFSTVLWEFGDVGEGADDGVHSSGGGTTDGSGSSEAGGGDDSGEDGGGGLDGSVAEQLRLAGAMDADLGVADLAGLGGVTEGSAPGSKWAGSGGGGGGGGGGGAIIGGGGGRAWALPAGGSGAGGSVGAGGDGKESARSVGSYGSRRAVYGGGFSSNSSPVWALLAGALAPAPPPPPPQPAPAPAPPQRRNVLRNAMQRAAALLNTAPVGAAAPPPILRPGSAGRRRGAPRPAADSGASSASTQGRRTEPALPARVRSAGYPPRVAAEELAADGAANVDALWRSSRTRPASAVVNRER